MLLGIKTDAPLVEFVLVTADSVVEKTTWQADRDLARLLLQRLATFVTQDDRSLQDIRGLFVYRGPGSYTGLRIGLTVMNTLAYAQNIPIVGTTGEQWLDLALQRLAHGENDHEVMPLYDDRAVYR